MDDGKCICCEKEIFEEQDYTTLICHAAGQTISHMTLAHDKCWEKFKKSFVRGRGTSSRTQTFFCPVAGCHNALQHQHLSVRKKTHGSGSAGPTAPKKADGLSTGADVADSYTALPGLDGAPRLPSKQGEPPRPPRSVCRESLTMCALVCNIVGGANRLSRHEADAEEVTRVVSGVWLAQAVIARRRLPLATPQDPTLSSQSLASSGAARGGRPVPGVQG